MPERIEFSQPVRTAEEASRALSTPKERVVKSVLLMLGEKRPLMCILTGDRRIDLKRIREFCGIKNVRTATPEEVKEHMG